MLRTCRIVRGLASDTAARYANTRAARFFDNGNPDKVDRNLPLETRDYIRAALNETNIVDERTKPLNHQKGATEFLGHAAYAEHLSQLRPHGATVTAAEDKRAISPHSQMAIALDTRLLAIVESPDTTPLEKSEQLVQCFAECREQSLPLKSSSCEAIMVTWASSVEPNISSNGLTMALDDMRGRSTPESFRYMEHMIQLHHYMKANYTAPTPRTMEALMRVTKAETQLRGPSERLLHLAVSLMQDHFQYMALPTHQTYADFFEVCAENRLMDLAVRYFAEAQDRLYIAPDSAMCRSIVSGLTKAGQPDDAIAFLARLEGVITDGKFLEASLDAFVQSDDPMSAFAAYRALCGPEQTAKAITPTVNTFTLLLSACQRVDVWTEAKFVLSEMQRHHVQGDEKCLNALLKGLLMSNLVDYARLLAQAMQRKRVPIWDSMTDAVKAIGVKPERRVDAATRRVSQSLINSGEDTRDERYLENKLREAARSGQLMNMTPSVLQTFLDRKGKLNDKLRDRGGPGKESRSHHALLARHVHSFFFGVKPKMLRGARNKVPTHFHRSPQA